MAFVVAVLVIITWAASGPIFGFSDTWQLVINTSTTIVTFLMVFVIQNTQNRDAKATQIKLDELIRAVHDARNRFIGEESEETRSSNATGRQSSRRRAIRRISRRGKETAASIAVDVIRQC